MCLRRGVRTADDGARGGPALPPGSCLHLCSQQDRAGGCKSPERSRDAPGCCACRGEHRSPKPCSPRLPQRLCWALWFLPPMEEAFLCITSAFPCPSTAPCPPAADKGLPPQSPGRSSPIAVCTLPSRLPSVTLLLSPLLAGEVSEALMAFAQLWLCNGSSCCCSPSWELCAWDS